MQKAQEWFKQDIEPEPDAEDLAMARAKREAIDRLDADNKAAAKAIYNVK